MAETVALEFLNRDGRVEVGSIEYEPDDETYGLTVCVDGETYKSIGGDFFDTFCRIRRFELEPRGWLPKCIGAEKDIWPSGMCRDMGRGLVAYKLTLGDPKTSNVEIFAVIENLQPVTVLEQEAFFNEWLASRGIQRR